MAMREKGGNNPKLHVLNRGQTLLASPNIEKSVLTLFKPAFFLSHSIDSKFQQDLYLHIKVLWIRETTLTVELTIWLHASYFLSAYFTLQSCYFGDKKQ